jgi:hypothetical protein
VIGSTIFAPNGVARASPDAPKRTKYAIVLSGERDEVVGWGYDEEGAIKIARALNEAEGR